MRRRVRSVCWVCASRRSTTARSRPSQRDSSRWRSSLRAMPTATVHGNDLHYLRRGEGEPLLLVMGMSGTHLSWGDPFLDALVAHGFEVITYDHRGVGRSSRIAGQFTLEELADDAAGLLDALGIDRAHVAGISMGGM